MKNCSKCNKEISFGEKFTTLDYNVENMMLSDGGLEVSVISSESIHTMCMSCSTTNNPSTVKAFLKNIVSQTPNQN